MAVAPIALLVFVGLHLSQFLHNVQKSSQWQLAPEQFDVQHIFTEAEKNLTQQLNFSHLRNLLVHKQLGLESHSAETNIPSKRYNGR